MVIHNIYNSLNEKLNVPRKDLKNVIIKVPHLSKKISVSYKSMQTVKDIILYIQQGICDIKINFGLLVKYSKGKQKFLNENDIFADEIKSANKILYLKKRRITGIDNVPEKQIQEINDKTYQSQFLKLIIKNDFKEILSMLQNGFDPNVLSGTEPLLFHAINSNFAPILVSLLLSYGAHIDLKSNISQTAVHKAVRASKPDVLQLFIQLGLQVDCIDDNGISPLYIASLYNKDTNCMDILFRYGAVIGSTDQRGLTEIHQASLLGKVDHLKMLLEKGKANINCATKTCGNTPLHFAVIGKSEQTVKFLIDNGANIYLKNYSSKTIFDMASELDPNIMSTITKYKSTIDYIDADSQEDKENSTILRNESSTSLQFETDKHKEENQGDIVLNANSEQLSRNSSIFNLSPNNEAVHENEFEQENQNQEQQQQQKQFSLEEDINVKKLNILQHDVDEVALFTNEQQHIHTFSPLPLPLPFSPSPLSSVTSFQQPLLLQQRQQQQEQKQGDIRTEDRNIWLGYPTKLIEFTRSNEYGFGISLETDYNENDENKAFIPTKSKPSIHRIRQWQVHSSEMILQSKPYLIEVNGLSVVKLPPKELKQLIDDCDKITLRIIYNAPKTEVYREHDEISTPVSSMVNLDYNSKQFQMYDNKLKHLTQNLLCINSTNEPAHTQSVHFPFGDISHSSRRCEEDVLFSYEHEQTSISQISNFDQYQPRFMKFNRCNNDMVNSSSSLTTNNVTIESNQIFPTQHVQKVKDANGLNETLNHQKQEPMTLAANQQHLAVNHNSSTIVHRTSIVVPLNIYMKHRS